MNVSVENTKLDAVKIVHVERFTDERGFFSEIFRKDMYEPLGIPTEYVQLNHSRSTKGIVRGLHFQWEPPMGKLMRVIRGQAFLVAVDLRVNSGTLGQHVAVTLSEDDPLLFWAPASFARGFAVLSEVAEIEYLTTGTYNKNAESGILWNDPELAIEWPVTDPILSKKDENAQTLQEWLTRPESRKFTC